MTERNRKSREPSGGWRGGLVLRLSTAALGTGLLVLAVVGALGSGRATAIDELDHTLSSVARAKSDALGEYFDRARSIELLMAQNSAFTQFDPARGLRPDYPTWRARRDAGAAMAYLEQLYPGRIGEACLIDDTGQEIARVVNGEAAPVEDLSSEEAAAPFFAPTLELKRGRVHQAAPYLSPDTGEWVISNSTPLYGESKQPWGMVHFEVTLSSFLDEVPDTETKMVTSIVDVRTGRVLLELGRQLRPDTLGRPASAELQSLVSSVPTAASVTMGEKRLRIVRVPPHPDNANSWAVVVSAPLIASWTQAVSPAALLTVLAALVLLSFALLNTVAHQKRLRLASLTDEVTGLPNRRHLNESLDQALARAHRRGTNCGVLLIDLDRFKDVNDTLGHHHGDVLLRCIGDRLRAAFRDSDLVARLGGDEFAVLMPDVADEASAVHLAERCRDALQDSFLIEGVALSVEASIGLAMAPDHGRDASDLLRAADVAMYRAKELHTGTVVYDSVYDMNTPSRLAILGDLRGALQSNELSMVYQPKVDLVTGTAHSVEALVRWQHSTRGLLMPADFIPVAEHTGLIRPLTLHTLEMALRQGRAWLDAGHPIQIAVNLSPRCLLDPDFAAQVVTALDRHRLPSHLLRLEVTESTIMADPAQSLKVLADLRSAGISLSIDDFGTGYSSMSYLKQLPVDELKIDRSFVTHMLARDGDRVLVRSSIELAHNLGMSVVAEGVEDEPTVAALSDLGCDVVQGYHLGMPMSPLDLGVWWAEQSKSQRIIGAPTP